MGSEKGTDVKQPHLQFALTGAAFLFLLIALVIPSRLSWIAPDSMAFVPRELLFLALLLLVPGRAGAVIRRVAAVLLAAGIIFKLADLVAYEVFSRQFNPVFDAYLLADGMNLLTGAIGRAGALLVAALLLALAIGIILLAFAVMQRIQTALQTRPRRTVAVVASVAVVMTLLSFAGIRRTSTLFYDQLVMHGRNTLVSIADIGAFRALVDIDAYANVPGDTLFGALAGKDVLVVFIESYGRVVLDKEEFALHVRPALEQNSRELAAQGFLAQSAFLTSPTVGGISWLAHGTVLSGLWIDSTVRYDSLVMSRRATLNQLFRRAGWRTVAVMPAISMLWPEGDYFGYDRIYAAQDLGYQGLPFNWVTMPDQYVLSAFEARERQPGQRAPVMAEIALISSHAPWTPTPELIAWDSVGDGSIFNAQALAGDPPEVVWQDNARIREQYRKSIEYVIADLVSYVLTYGDDDLVLLIMGDHQPAPLVTGELANHDVPVHLIARDPAVLAAVADWRWSNGLLPAADAPVWRMDEVRDRLLAAFSAPVTDGGSLPDE
jgi:phosphoglycerol transferase MdoB-like AlkP superfamily enzyme